LLLRASVGSTEASKSLAARVGVVGRMLLALAEPFETKGFVFVAGWFCAEDILACSLYWW
jgi:hypothetical protein